MAQKSDGPTNSRVADLIICRPEIAAFRAPRCSLIEPRAGARGYSLAPLRGLPEATRAAGGDLLFCRAPVYWLSLVV
jgi:hypothetical protein